MKGFIEVTRLANGSHNPFLIALHTIGTLKPKFLGATAGTEIVLSFGSSGKEEHTLNEDYQTVVRLIEEAQEPVSTTPKGNGTTW